MLRLPLREWASACTHALKPTCLIKVNSALDQVFTLERLGAYTPVEQVMYGLRHHYRDLRQLILGLLPDPAKTITSPPTEALFRAVTPWPFCLIALIWRGLVLPAYF